MAARFVIRRAEAPGREPVYTFQLLDAGGRLLLSSEGYQARRGAVRGIEAVRRLAPDATIVAEEPA